MKKFILVLFILISFSCTKENDIQPEYNATVLSYDSRKCYCLYGWKIIYNGDTILSTSDVLRTKIGFEIEKPINLNIYARLIDSACKYPYYEISKIKAIWK